MKFPSQIKISDHFSREFVFENLEAFERFIQTQADFWLQKQSIASQSPIANSFIQRFNGFQTIITTIKAWRPELETWDASTFNSNFTSLLNSSIGASWLWSGHPFVEKWVELTSESINTADAFFEAIVQKTTRRFADGLDFFQGYVIAYEYVNQGKTGINKRRKSEEKSLDKLRTELAEKQTELISEVSDFQSDINKWKETTKEELADLLVKKETCLDETNEFHSKTFHAQYANWTDKVIELENKYLEKLRFESPATYWARRAGTVRKQGYYWILALVLTIVGSTLWFSNYFLAWLSNEKPTKLGLDSIEGLIIFAAILSSIAFLIRALSRLAFSSFHLMRDAEEREQLTHLYLALRDGRDDDPEARKIILQTLFSRSETGLLNGEQGPTMPTTAEVLSVLNKK